MAGAGGVIFDVDGTLLDTNYLHVAAWWDAFRERGHDIRCADVHRALGMGSSDLVELVLGRPDGGWLATWSRADAVVSHPIEPVALAEALAGLMRDVAAGRALQSGA